MIIQELFMHDHRLEVNPALIREIQEEEHRSNYEEQRRYRQIRVHQRKRLV